MSYISGLESQEYKVLWGLSRRKSQGCVSGVYIFSLFTARRRTVFTRTLGEGEGDNEGFERHANKACGCQVFEGHENK